MAQVDLKIRTVADLQGVQQLKKSLQEIQTMMKDPDHELLVSSFSAKEIQKTINAVNTLDRAIDAAFDVNLNSINIDKFNQYLKKSDMSVNTLYKDLSRLGTQGQKAFLQMTQATLTMGQSIKRTNTFIDEMKTTLSNTVKWGISSSMWNNMLSAVQQAYGYVKGLDKDLNDIRIVTGKSADQMERFAKQANRAAKDLAVSTRDYTQGALIYYQQGLSDEEVAARTNITAKASNVTGQDMSTVSEQLTAVWNGYQAANQAAKEGMQVYEQYVDKMAAVAASTASDLEEQATAMSKVASAAYSMGVGFDELNAQISTIVSVTRQAPESVGTALKTIYARLGDLQVDGVDEFGTSLGDVSGKLQTMGIEVMDSNGQMREMDEVMTEVAAKWDTWTDAQKQAAAVAMAGKRQYNNLIALFDNWDMYGESLKTSMESAGTLSEQQGIALDSLENKMERMQAAAEKFYDALFDEKSLGGIIDALTGIVDMVGSLTQGLGGLKNILPIVGGLLLKTFKSDIGKNIASGVMNLKNENAEINNDKKRQEYAAQLSSSKSVKITDKTVRAESKALANTYSSLMKYKQIMTKEDLEAVNNLLEQKRILSEQKVEQKKQQEILKENNKLAEKYLEQMEVAQHTKSKTTQEQTQAKMKQTRTDMFKQQEVAEKIGAKMPEDLPLSLGTNISTLKKDMNISTKKDKEAFDEIVSIRNIQKLKDEGKTTAEIMEELQKKIKATFGEKSLEKAPKTLQAIAASLDDMDESGEDSWESIKKIVTEISGLSASNKHIQKLRKEFIRLKDSGLSTTEALARATEGMSDEAKAAINLTNEIEKLRHEEEMLKQNEDAMKEQLGMQETFQNIADAAGGVVTTVSGVIGVFNAFKVASDTSMTSSERWKAALSGGAASLVMIGQGLSSIIPLLKLFNTEQKISTLTLLNRQFAEKGAVLVEQLYATQLGKTALAQKLETAANNLRTQQGKKSIIMKIAEAIATKTLKKSTDQLSASILKLYMMCAWILIIVAAVILIFIAVTAVINHFTKALEKNAKSAEHQLETQKKVTEAAREQKTAIDELNTAYEDLAQQYEDGTLSLEDLRTQTYDLCLQYDQESLAVRTLTADYEELNDIMNQAQKNADYGLQSSMEREAELRSKALAATYAADQNATTSTFVDDRGKTLDIHDFWGRFDASQESYDALVDTLAKYDIETDWSGHIDSTEFFTQAALYYDDLLADLQAAEAPEAQNLVDAMLENKEALQENSNVLAELRGMRTNANLSTMFTETSADSIQSTQDYDKLFIQAVKQLIASNDAIDKDEDKMFISMANTEEGQQRDIQHQAEQAVKKYFRQFENAALWEQRATVVDALQSAKGDKANAFSDEVLSQQLEGLSDAEYEFVVSNINLAAAYDSIEEFVEDYQEQIKFLNSKRFQVQLQTVTEDEDLSLDEIDEIYTNFTNFAEQTGYTQDEFTLLNYNQQMGIMMDYYLKEQQYAIQNKDIIIKNIEEELQAYKDANQEKAEIAGASTDIFYKKYDFAKNTGLDENSFDALMTSIDVNTLGQDIEYAALQKYTTYEEALQEYGHLNITAEQFNALKQAVQEGELTFHDLQQYLQDYDTVDQYTKTISDLTAAIEDADNATVNYVENQKILEQMEKDATESIDNVVSSYKNLQGIVEQYNTDGFLTLENALSLLSMDPLMLTALDWDTETQSMSINTDVIKKNILARIEEAKIAVMEQATNQLLALSIEDVTIRKEIDRLVSEGYIDVLEAEEQQVRNVALGYQKLSDAMRGNKDADIIIDNAEDQLNALKDLAESTKDNLGGMLNGTVDKNDLKKLDEEIDRYWDINHAISEIEETMEDLERVQKRLHGKELIASLKDENNLLRKQKEAYEELGKEQQVEVDELQKKLGRLGVDFFANGEVANYEEAMKAAVNRYNSAVSNTNITEASKKAITEQYEEFVEMMERYDELTTEELVETQNKIEEIKLSMIDNEFEAWKVDVEVALDTQQLERDWADFAKDLKLEVGVEYTDLQSSMDAAYAKFQSYKVDEGTTDINLNALQDIMNEMDIMNAGGESEKYANISEAREVLKKYFEQAQDSALEQKETFEEMWDVYLEGIDQASDKFEDIIEQHDRINEQLEYEKELVELFYGEEAYSKLNNIYQAQAANTLGQIENTKQQLDLWTQLYNQAEEGDADRARYYELMTEAQSSLNDLTIQHIEILKNQYANTVNGILKGFETTITNGSTFDDLSEEWDRMKEKSDKYFDSVESLYEIQKFANTMQGSINSTTDIKNQQKLQDLYDRELEYLKEKENLTQYDLDAAEARYQIALKEIALEDAQNAKNSMKLTRGADGNWSYQYVADQDNILSKQQELSDAYNNLYQLANSAYEENLESAMQLQEDYVTQLNEIANNELLTDEERKNKAKELEERYLTDMELLAQENTLYRQDLELSSAILLTNLRDQDEENYKLMTDAEKTMTDIMRDNNIKDYNDIYEASEDTYNDIASQADKMLGDTLASWTTTAQGIVDQWVNNEDGVRNTIMTTTQDILDKWAEYQVSVETGAAAAGTDIQSLGDDYADVTTEVEELKNKTNDLITKTTTSLTGYQATVTAVGGVWETVASKIDTALTNAKNYFSYVGQYKDFDIDFDDNGKIKDGNTNDVEKEVPIGNPGGDNPPGNTRPKNAISFKAAANGPELFYRELTKENQGDYAISGNQGSRTIQSKDFSGTYYISDDDYEYLSGELGFTANFGKATPNTKEVAHELKRKIDAGGGLAKVQYIGSSGYHFQLHDGSYFTYDVDDYGKMLSHFQGLITKKSGATGATTGITRMATGGYTGDWGSEGKLAVLHEKELVLNKADTENILNTVSMVRNLEQGLMGKIAGMLAGLSTLGVNGHIPTISNMSDSSNVFNITAEFPNANDVTSIREAILSLPNIASQYIAEKKK